MNFSRGCNNTTVQIVSACWQLLWVPTFPPLLLCIYRCCCVVTQHAQSLFFPSFFLTLSAPLVYHRFLCTWNASVAKWDVGKRPLASPWRFLKSPSSGMRCLRMKKQDSIVKPCRYENLLSPLRFKNKTKRRERNFFKFSLK